MAAGPSPSSPPSPREVLGFDPGDDYQLADFRQLREYFGRLDSASDRVTVSVAGQSTQGNDMLVAAISSEANLARLGEYRDIARRLALVGDVSPDEARALARRGKAVVWIDNGLHASEVAASQHAIALAHELATSESGAARAIRDNVILLLLPSINPDGMNMVVDWYRRHRGTAHQDSPLPWLYQEYVGHDTNRDFFMQTQRETRVLNRLLYREWLPQVMHNHHQGIWPARMFVPPFPDPINPHIDSQVMDGVNEIGRAIERRLDAEERDGVVSRYGFSAWYNGSIRTTSYFHNILGILTEVSHPSATPYRYDRRRIPPALSNGVPAREPSATYRRPWIGGTLRLRDAVEYMRTGSLAVLDHAARNRERLLYGIYEMGRRQIALGSTEAPVAYVVPQAEQHDAPAAAAFLDVLMKGGVEVHRARARFSTARGSYPAGTHVILLSQPFRPFVRDLVEPQRYPDLRDPATARPVPPYDAAGWTLAYQMGVRVVPIDRPFETSALELLEEPPRAPALLDDPHGREAWGYLIDPSANAAFTAVNRLLAGGARVGRLTAAFAPRPGVDLPAGTWVVRRPDAGVGTAGAGLHAPSGRPASPGDSLRQLVTTLGLRAWSIDREPPVPSAPVRHARLGVYRSWVANIDEGWMRWVLEQHGFPYETIRDRDVRAGRLRERFDVIVLPSQASNRLLQGHQPSDRPPHPGPWGPVPPEYQGGIGEEGLAALREFAAGGGTLVAIDAAADLVLSRFGGAFEAIASTTEGVGRDAFYCPGSLVRIATSGSHPATWGMAGEAAAFFQGSRAFRPTDPSVRGIARYAPAGRVLMSGWLLGEAYIANQYAAIDVPYDQGRVILYGFRPHFRAQSHGTFKLLFNVLMPGRARSPSAPHGGFGETALPD